MRLRWQSALTGALALGVAGAAVAAERLTAEGTALPALTCPAAAPCEVTVDAGEDTVLDAHVVLRPASSNYALARDLDGYWAPWDGDPASLPSTAVRREGATLVFKLFAAPPRTLMAPYTVTVAYKTPNGLRVGWFEASVEGSK